MLRLMTVETVRATLSRAIADIELTAALLPLFTTDAAGTRARARLKATSSELAVLRARLREGPSDDLTAGQLVSGPRRVEVNTRGEH